MTAVNMGQISQRMRQGLGHGVWVSALACGCGVTPRAATLTPNTSGKGGLAWLRQEHQGHLRWGCVVRIFQTPTEAQNTSGGSDTVPKCWEQADPGSQLGSGC